MKITPLNFNRVSPLKEGPLAHWMSAGATWHPGVVRQIYNLLEDAYVEEAAVAADPKLQRSFAAQDAKAFKDFSKGMEVAEVEGHPTLKARTWQDVIAGVMFAKLGRNQRAQVEIVEKEQTIKLSNGKTQKLDLLKMGSDLHTAMNSFMLLNGQPMINYAGKDLPKDISMSADPKLAATVLDDFLKKYEWVAKNSTPFEMENLCQTMKVPAGIPVAPTNKPVGVELN